MVQLVEKGVCVHGDGASSEEVGTSRHKTVISQESRAH